jgi:hypothetical protein
MGVMREHHVIEEMSTKRPATYEDVLAAHRAEPQERVAAED